MDTPLIRPATIADAVEIATVMHGGMSATVQRITILGSPLLHAYVAAQIASTSGDSFTVAEVNGRTAGVATWRRIKRTLTLNHLYVRAEFRGHGIGALLMIDGLQQGLESDVETVAVDVFSESQRALTWYVALGMERQYRRTWLEMPLPALRSMSARPCTIEGMEQADLEHARLGFSQFRLITPAAGYAIGRLSGAVFRTAGFGILSDRHALEALGTLDARRALICIGAPEDLPAAGRRGGRLVEESERLTIPLPKLAAALDRAVS